MKKIIFLLVALVPLLAMAQFNLVPGGYVTEEGKSYTVIEMEGTQAELYKKAKSALTTLYKSAEHVLTEDEPNSIVVNSFDKRFDMKAGLGVRCACKLKYRFQIFFKDGKIRIDAPDIQFLTGTKDIPMSMNKGKNNIWKGETYFFNEKEEPADKKTFEQLNAWPNTWINNLVTLMKNGGAIEDADW